MSHMNNDRDGVIRDDFQAANNWKLLTDFYLTSSDISKGDDDLKYGLADDIALGILYDMEMPPGETDEDNKKYDYDYAIHEALRVIALRNPAFARRLMEMVRHALIAEKNPVAVKPKKADLHEQLKNAVVAGDISTAREVMRAMEFWYGNTD